MPIVLKSGGLNLLEPSGPVQACNGIAFNDDTEWKPTDQELWDALTSGSVSCKLGLLAMKDTPAPITLPMIDTLLQSCCPVAVEVGVALQFEGYSVVNPGKGEVLVPVPRWW